MAGSYCDPVEEVGGCRRSITIQVGGKLGRRPSIEDQLSNSSGIDVRLSINDKLFQAIAPFSPPQRVLRKSKL